MDTDHHKPYNVPFMRVAPMYFKEKTFWEKGLTPDEQFRDVASIDYIDYNPHNLDQLLVSSLARISVYDSNSLELKRTFKTDTQFQVYGGAYRKNDGRLMAAGSEEGKVFVCEINNTAPLRTFNLKAPTHRVLFMGNELVSFSDDKAIRLLDVGGGTTLRAYGGPEDRTASEVDYLHKDYVRCGCLISQLIVSGSYDRTVKIWDPRTNESRPVMQFEHGHSVESVCTRGETLLISVGGNKLQVFDMVAAKALTNIIPKHHKTITSVANYEDKYLLTGALDGYLNILDFNYEYITRFSYDNAQILSLVANPKFLAVGFNTPHIHVKKFKDYIKKSNIEIAEYEKLQSGYFGPNMVTRYFHEAIAESQDPAATHRAMLAIKQKKTPVALSDVSGLHEPVVIPRLKPRKKVNRAPYENMLSQFKHSLALDQALKHLKDDFEAVIFVLHELMKRGKFGAAVTRSRKVIALMKFIAGNMDNIRHNKILLDSGLDLIGLILRDKNLIQQNNPEFWINVDRLLLAAQLELGVIDLCTSVGAQLNTIMAQY